MRDPRVYGAPGTGLVNPPTDRARDVAQSPTKAQGKGDDRAPYLRVRIGGLERNRKDLLIRFDASVRVSLLSVWL